MKKVNKKYPSIVRKLCKLFFYNLDQGCSWCGAVFGHFQHHILQCGLAKTITAPHLVFAVTCAVRCNAVWCGLEFSQNHNHTASHFCDHMCDTMYKMRFEVGIFFKFWDFPTQPKTNFSPFFGPSFKLLSQVFFILGWLFQLTLARVIKLFFS